MVPYLIQPITYGENRKVFFEVYGCQMNVSDTEVIWSILKKSHYQKTDNIREADVILIGEYHALFWLIVFLVLNQFTLPV